MAEEKEREENILKKEKLLRTGGQAEGYMRGPHGPKNAKRLNQHI